MRNPQIYLIDVDKTLTNETCWTEEECLIATPNMGVISWVNEKYKDNFIVIYTARRSHLYQATIKWLSDNGINYHAVKFDKTPGVIVDLDAINNI